jgi:hypothetical protein
MSAIESEMQYGCWRSLSPRLKRFSEALQQRQGLSSAMSTESYIQQLLPQLTVARNASTLSPVIGQDMMMLHGLGGPNPLQLLMMRLQSQQGLGLASAALATARNSQLQPHRLGSIRSCVYLRFLQSRTYLLHGLRAAIHAF